MKTVSIVVIGSTGAGKTSLIRRYIEGKFEESANHTVGMAFYTKVHLDFKVNIWDTASAAG